MGHNKRQWYQSKTQTSREPGTPAVPVQPLGCTLHCVSSQGLGQPRAVACCLPSYLSPELALLTAPGCPGQMFHTPGLCSSRGSPRQLWLHPHSFTRPLLSSCPQELWLGHTWPGLPGGSHRDPTMLAFCMPAKPASCAQSQGLLPAPARLSPLDHSYGWAWERFTRWPITAPDTLFLKQSLTNDFTLLHPWACQSWEASKASVLWARCKVLSFSFSWVCPQSLMLARQVLTFLPGASLKLESSYLWPPVQLRL
jgi:hypothetical protein